MRAVSTDEASTAASSSGVSARAAAPGRSASRTRPSAQSAAPDSTRPDHAASRIFGIRSTKPTAIGAAAAERSIQSSSRSTTSTEEGIKSGRTSTPMGSTAASFGTGSRTHINCFAGTATLEDTGMVAPAHTRKSDERHVHENAAPEPQRRAQDRSVPPDRTSGLLLDQRLQEGLLEGDVGIPRRAGPAPFVSFLATVIERQLRRSGLPVRRTFSPDAIRVLSVDGFHVAVMIYPDRFSLSGHFIMHNNPTEFFDA